MAGSVRSRILREAAARKTAVYTKGSFAASGRIRTIGQEPTCLNASDQPLEGLLSSKTSRTAYASYPLRMLIETGRRSIPTGRLLERGSLPWLDLLGGIVAERLVDYGFFCVVRIAGDRLEWQSK